MPHRLFVLEDLIRNPCFVCHSHETWIPGQARDDSKGVGLTTVGCELTKVA